MDDLAEVMEECDYLVLCMALTEKTKGVVHSGNLAKAKPGMVLINIGRGALVVEDDLVAALQPGGRLQGAALVSE